MWKLHSIIKKIQRHLLTLRVNFVTGIILKKHCIKVEKGIKFLGMPVIKIRNGGHISIGADFVCRSSPEYAIGNFCCSKIDVREGGNLLIGNQVGISNTVIQCHKEIVIGNYVNIGDGVLIMDTNFHSTDWQTRANRKIDTQNKKSATVIIGDYAFIGTRSIICKGVSIGEKSIIAAGSVVIKDIPSNVIAGGNPCKVIKTIAGNEL